MQKQGIFLLLAAALFLAGCAMTTTRAVVGQYYDPHTGTLWLVEHSSKSEVDDVVRVTVCHREGVPACVQHTPKLALEPVVYRAWLDQLPREVRRLAHSSPSTSSPAVSPSPDQSVRAD